MSYGGRRAPLAIAGAASAVALLLVAAGCGGAGGDGAAQAPRRTAVHVLMAAEPASLSLLGKMDRNSEILAAQLTDSLVQYAPDLRLVPRVAREWEISPDGTELTFRLRPGVRWHDGRPVTADDVVFSVETVRDPQTENRTFLPVFESLESVEAVDPLTVRARYSSMTPDVLEGWRVPLIPRHLAGTGEGLLTGAFAREPVGCGPFRFVAHRPGEELVLEANDDYWDGRPAIDRLVFRFFPDQRTGYQALLSGALDMMVVDTSLIADAEREVAAGTIERFDYSSLALWHIMWNVDGSNPFFDDPRVRTAMVLALDRWALIEHVLDGAAIPAVTSYHPQQFWADPALEPLPWDPQRAARLLDEAGWVDEDGDGVRERGGRPFRFTLIVAASTMPVVDQMLAWQQQAWAELGIRAEIEKLEFQAFRQRRREHAFEAAEGQLLFTPSPDQYELYHSSQRAAGYNFGGVSDPELDRLLELGRRTFDEPARVAVYRDLQRRLHELQPLAALFHFSSPVLHDPALEGVEPSPLDHYRTARGPRVWRWAPRPTGG